MTRRRLLTMTYDSGENQVTIKRKAKMENQHASKEQQESPRGDLSQPAGMGLPDENKAPQRPTGRKWKSIKSRLRKVVRLKEYWPDLFNLDDPKPLKIGVMEDLQSDVKSRGLSFGAGSLKAALAAYTRRRKYQAALAAGGYRYGLAGQVCGSVTPEQQQAAAGTNKASEV